MAEKKNSKKKNNLVGQKFTCNKCGKLLAAESNFFKIQNNTLCNMPIFPVCKDCLKEEYERLKFEHGDRSGLKVILRKMDRPYIDKVVEQAFEREKGNELGYCLKTLSGLNQYSSLTYDDSDCFKDKVSMDTNRDVKNKLDELDDKEWNRWAKYGLEPEQIVRCNEFYNNIIYQYEIKTLNDTISVEQLAVSYEQMAGAYKDKNASDVERFRKVISGIESDLNIQARQIQDNLDKECFGNFIRSIEDTEPIPEPKSEFKDVDGIGKIIKRYIIGYLPVAMGKAREQDVLQEDENILDEY